MSSYEVFESKSTRCLYTICGCCCSRSKYHLDSLYIGGRWPNPRSAILPDNIFWENLSVGSCSGFIRRSISKILGFVFLIGAITCILAIGFAAKKYDDEVQIPDTCPPVDEYTKEDVWTDHSEYGNIEGLVHCYCYNEVITKTNIDAINMLFIESDPGSNLCSEWLQNYSAKKYLKQLESFSVVIINIIATLIFEFLGKF